MVDVSEHQFQPQEVLLSMRGYIQEFFGCRECSKNFAKGAVHIEEKVLYADDSIMFLWRSHNKANSHLHGDVTEDPEHPKVQFPPWEMCPSCHGEKKGDDAIQWNEPAVLQFLKALYSKDNIHSDIPGGKTDKDEEAEGKQRRRSDMAKFASDKAKRRVGKVQEGVENMESRTVHINTERMMRLQLWEKESRYRERVPRPSTSITSVDISMCVVFYVICTSIIILGYYHFSVRRRMRMCPTTTLPL